MILSTGGRDHCYWVNYRANVYSTMRDTPNKARNPGKTGVGAAREDPRASIGTSQI